MAKTEPIRDKGQLKALADYFLKQGQLTHHPVASLDVVGHEYTHGIIEYSSNLNSSVEALKAVFFISFLISSLLK